MEAALEVTVLQRAFPYPLLQPFFFLLFVPTYCSESEALRSEAAVMYVGLGLVVAQTTTDRFLVGFGFEDKGRV